MTPTESFISHLIELRNRLLRAVAGWLVIFVALFPFADRIYHLLAAPLLAKLPQGAQMIATAVTTPFFVPMKVTMMAAFLIALPWMIYQCWAFIAPGLYAHEKRLIRPLLAAAIGLFFMGMAFAYFAVFPVVFGFLVGSAPAGVAVMTDIAEYLDFVIGMFLAFGFAFEVPIAVILLSLMGWVTLAQLKEARSYVIVGAFVLGAIFTPPDIVSQCMLAIPLWLLYELGLLVVRWLPQSPADSATPT
ncbi:twin-arginine translocase subunit TatC [Methylophilus glucosoxydans]|jgi:sec-independent protein translocase protein TatC|uniref:Sec-independent protein translocase protein TatC n=1 Tax=Methylophilus glucosoxydans TaxID=752553 RepID=A0ABW3GHH5_9PROT|nr:MULTISPECIES: twin-arginine translocase subunit TatC [unclassified Methylophilus]MBF5039692.1 twin-arginine translocase subunit TatC [Methylophilus sp. 13]MDT7848936.1 twin-arginine translocase subunit TatC [Methylophilus sp. VKM B-3414]